MNSFKNLKKTFFIAEIGNNHEGSYKNAIKLIDQAKKSGADAVKFQTFDTNYFINRLEEERFAKLKSFELTKKDFKRLSIYSKKKGIKFISTPLDLGSAKFLSKIVHAFKISSGDNNFYELIKLCASFKKPLIISTGMLNLMEIKKIIKILSKLKFPHKKLAFLHCVSDYPVKDNEANLLSIKYLRDKLPVTIGYSDHVIGSESCLIAASLGAKIIEKHFTLNNNFSNFRDHKISLNPKDMQQMIFSTRRIENMLGLYDKKISQNEKRNQNAMRRSIYFNKKLKKGTILKRQDLKIVRPYKVIEPNDLPKVVGKKLKKDVMDSAAVSFKILK
jgi:sialic acid synthase SpsE|tara:strand:+ start:778 stop:1773 length:996 start_codon:yes stop_codon:yes gene_type:complete